MGHVVLSVRSLQYRVHELPEQPVESSEPLIQYRVGITDAYSTAYLRDVGFMLDL